MIGEWDIRMDLEEELKNNFVVWSLGDLMYMFG